MDSHHSSNVSLPTQCVFEEFECKRGHEGSLLVVRGSAVPTLNVLVVERLALAHVEQLAYHLASVTRVHAVIARRSREEDGRVLLVRVDIVVRRVLLEVRPILLRIAVLAHPRGSGQKLVEAVHVKQRHLADDRTEQIGAGTDEHIAGEQPAITAALAAEVRRACDAALNQVSSDRFEVLVRLVPIRFQRRLVPLRAILATATDVGNYVRVALLEPGGTNACRVARR
mmetsp:Transcript_20155/g.51331  ORF Transcript_20155/g.51331 Transcript_20155/m.51331 type:complete len:227 (+) Transcript_20155:149-829(+)